MAAERGIGEMIRERYKLVLIYAGIPVLGLALIFLRAEETDPFVLIWRELIIVFGYIAAFLDLESKKIPNNLLLAMFGTWVITTALTLLVNSAAAVLLLKDAIFGCAIGGGIFLFVYLVSSKGLGGGDVKFMAAAGLYMGSTGTLSALLCGTVFAALTGILLLIRKKVSRRDSIPLAPFLYAGILLTVFFTN